MKRTGLAGLLFAVLAVPVAHADVTVRVEGATTTLVNTTVAQTGPDVTKAGATCSGASGAGALDRAVGGDWDADNYGGSDPLFVNTVKGEAVTYTPDNPRYWSFSHGNTFSNEGVCGYTPTVGDELLFYPRCDSPAATGCFDGLPLDLTAPATATTGVPFTVAVRQFTDAGTPSPAEGASVDGAVTGADGTAQVTLNKAGTTTLVATKGRQVRDEATVVVSDPPAPGASPAPAATATPTPSPAPVADTRPPYSAISGIREQQVFRPKRAPRTLRAAVDEPVAQVTLGLTRQVGRRCRAFSDTRAAFVRSRCGRHPRFAVGDRDQISYLLPKRLPRGRYVFDVVSTDTAGNEEHLARGRNRVVFFVR